MFCLNKLTHHFRCSQSALPGILRTCKDKVLGLPTMQEYILANIDSLPDWKLYLASRVPEYGNFIEQ